MQNFTRNPIRKAPGLENTKNIFKNRKNCFQILKIDITTRKNIEK